MTMGVVNFHHDKVNPTYLCCFKSRIDLPNDL